MSQPDEKCPKCGEHKQNHNDVKCEMRYPTACPICNLPDGNHNTILHRGIQEPSKKLLAEIATLFPERPEPSPTSDGLDREKLLKYLREGVEGFEKTYRKEASQIRALITTLESGRFDAPAASRGADKWEKLKAVRKDLDGCRQMADRLSCRNDGSYDAGKHDAFETAIELIDDLLALESSKQTGEGTN